MFIFRLISFVIRVVSAFILTFILQIQWDGKSLESYLIRFGEKSSMVQAINQVGQDGVVTIRSLTASTPPPGKDGTSGREIAGKLEPFLQKIKTHLVFPAHPLKEKKPPQRGNSVRN